MTEGAPALAHLANFFSLQAAAYNAYLTKSVYVLQLRRSNCGLQQPREFAFMSSYLNRQVEGENAAPIYDVGRTEGSGSPTVHQIQRCYTQPTTCTVKNVLPLAIQLNLFAPLPC